jgi:DNA repair exonuclease SbcCD ATPase subunit
LHLKPASKWLVILALIMVTLSALVLASSQASVQQTTATSDKTQDLFSLFQNANATVAEIFRQLEADSKTVPQASLDEYNQALVLAEESKSLLQAGNYSEADSKIIQALQKLKEALRIVYTTIPEQPTETETALERAVQLKSSINRYYEQLERIENLTRLAAAVGYNTTTLEAKIQAIKSLLDRALNNVEQKRFEAALDNLADAKALSDRILSSINNFAADLKIQRIETYINQTQERLDAIRETAESLSNDASLAALNNAETSLDNAKEYLEEQRINETLSELANSKESEEEAVEYLKPAASSLDSTSSSTPNAVQPP